MKIICVLFLAYEYEKLQSNSQIFEDFFSNSAHKIQTNLVQQWLDQLIECRSLGKQFQLPSDSNLNTILKHILYDNQGSILLFINQPFHSSFSLSLLGTFLYNFPSSDLRSKSTRAHDPTQFLTNLIQGFKPTHN